MRVYACLLACGHIIRVLIFNITKLELINEVEKTEVDIHMATSLLNGRLPTGSANFDHDSS